MIKVKDSSDITSSMKNPFFMGVLNSDLRFGRANPLFFDGLGIPFLNPEGKRPGDLIQCTNAVQSPEGCGTSVYCTFCPINNSLELAKKEKKPISRTANLLLKSGEGTTPLDFTIFIYPDITEDETQYYCYIHDDSEKNKREMLEQLFFHDVLNSLSSLSGLMTLREELGQSTLNGTTLTDMAKNEINHITEMVIDQRDFRNAERGDLAIEYHLVDLNHLLQDLIEIAKKLTSYKNQSIHLVTMIAQDIITDGTILKRILTNMVKNSIEATEPETTITLRALITNKKEILIEVENDGEIPPSVASQIFHRSCSTKGSRRGYGTYSMKLYGEDYLKGRIEFSSKDGKTVFSLLLPPLPGESISKKLH